MASFHKHIIDNILMEVALTDAPPTDYKSYFTGMAKGVNDKLFFLNQIKPDLIVDFGSADGYVLGKIHEYNPHIALIGYDISPDMIKFSSDKYTNIKFTNSWSSIPGEVAKYQSPCLLLSSVIHEVYSYSTPENIEKFWKEIFNAGFEYIVIRDTIPSETLEKVIDFKKDVRMVKGIVDPNLVKDYENKWGPLEKDYKNFVRFVLMYRYKDNWSRERLEDYLPLTYEQLIKKILPQYTNSYRIIYDKKFKFKPIQRSFSKDFNIALRQDIHLKMILRKK